MHKDWSNKEFDSEKTADFDTQILEERKSVIASVSDINRNKTICITARIGSRFFVCKTIHEAKNI